MREELFDESLSSLDALVTEYEELQATLGTPQPDAPRLRIC